MRGVRESWALLPLFESPLRVQDEQADSKVVPEAVDEQQDRERHAERPAQDVDGEERRVHRRPHDAPAGVERVRPVRHDELLVGQLAGRLGRQVHEGQAPVVEVRVAEHRAVPELDAGRQRVVPAVAVPAAGARAGSSGPQVVSIGGSTAASSAGEARCPASEAASEGPSEEGRSSRSPPPPAKAKSPAVSAEDIAEMQAFISVGVPAASVSTPSEKKAALAEDPIFIRHEEGKKAITPEQWAARNNGKKLSLIHI